MDPARASASAIDVAAFRAAHLELDPPPWIFEDRVARVLLADDADSRFARFATLAPEVYAGFRLMMVNRARYTEDCLAAAVDDGVDQYLVLGAGFDSFAYRSSLASVVRIFEVDHFATQTLKRERLRRSGVAEPPSLTFVAADLSSGPPMAALEAAGFDPERPVFVSLLGVSQYLERSALVSILDALARLSTGSQLVLSHILPAADRDALGQAVADAYTPGTARAGEPWLTTLAVSEVRAVLEGCGFAVVEQVDRTAAAERFFARVPNLTLPRLGGLTRAVVPTARR